MTDAPHILVVDDHQEIRDLLAKFLKRGGLRVSTAESAKAARDALKASAVDLVVLDVMMPGESGLSLCRHLRETEDIPVILLTAMDDETDRIVGLEIGADDYVTKPFNPRELQARIGAVLRRSRSLPKTPETAATARLGFAGHVFDPDRREVTRPDGETVTLSAAEFRLLLALLERPRVVLSRDQLLDLAAGRDARLFDRSIDNRVSRLRRKIEADPRNPVLIQTVWGGGYRLAADVERLE